MTKLLSPCCQARAKVNVRDGGYFCSWCGEGCRPVEKGSGLQTRSTLSTVRKPSGEKALMIQLWAKCKGLSEASGTKLLGPEHRLFHYQGSHLLPKGSFPEYRLDPRNIVMITVDEHERWHTMPHKFREEFPHIAKRYNDLYLEAQRKNPLPAVPGKLNQ